tara:strand:- start:83 stop:379 length:297 start_codon:yes stop_codon:yes gene_type:complete
LGRNQEGSQRGFYQRAKNKAVKALFLSKTCTVLTSSTRALAIPPKPMAMERMGNQATAAIGFLDWNGLCPACFSLTRKTNKALSITDPLKFIRRDFGF